MYTHVLAAIGLQQWPGLYVHAYSLKRLYMRFAYYASIRHPSVYDTCNVIRFKVPCTLLAPVRLSSHHGEVGIVISGVREGN